MTLPIIALLTDFGLTDPYVGIMKGVISQISPPARLIDLTHLVAPGDIQQGAYLLWQASQDLPPGTVFLAVVDPGVGTERKAIYLRCGNQIFIGPDNGLFSYLGNQASRSAWELTNPKYQLDRKSRTFHGRDIFAPAAAHAACGIPGEEFGPVLQNPISLPSPLEILQPDHLEGEIIHQDRFGNLITSLGYLSNQGGKLAYKSWLTGLAQPIPVRDLSIQIGPQELPLVSTFARIPSGKCAGLIGSTGLLEIAANQQSAGDLLEAGRGERVKLTWS